MLGNWALKIAGLTLVTAFALSPAQAGFEVRARYAQGNGNVWKSISDLQSQSLLPADLAELLNTRYRKPLEVHGMVDANFQAPLASDTFWGIPTHGYLGARVDALASGRISNRILPEIEASTVATAQGYFGLKRRPKHNEGGLMAQLGTSLGLGYIAQLSSSASALIDSVPLQKSALFFWGLDSVLGMRSLLGPTLRSEHRILFRPTWFTWDHSDSGTTLNETDRLITWRWRVDNEWAFQFVSPFEGGAEVSLFTLTGPQPIPYDLLPRAWDAVHRLAPLPALGTMVGLGTGIDFYSDDAFYRVRIKGGFFGGYVGGHADIILGDLSLTLGTYGVEQSSTYHSRESRFHFLQAGWSL